MVSNRQDTMMTYLRPGRVMWRNFRQALGASIDARSYCLGAVLVGEDGVDPGGAAGTTAGQQVGQGEAVEREDGVQQTGHDDDVLEARQGDVEELPPGARAVNRRGFVLLGVDCLETGHQQ